MITVEQALAQLFALVAPLPHEAVALQEAAGRVLAADAVARRDQPPFAASAMDGYAIPDADPAPGARYRVIGTSAAGHRFDGALGPAEAVRIFTGAPLPERAARVLIQEDTARDGDTVTLTGDPGAGSHIRPAGNDFRAGDRLKAPRLLGPRDIALAAAMNVAQLTVARVPEVALIATGDELVLPGDSPGPDQIVASNTYGLHAMLRALGARPRLLPIARDSVDSLTQVFGLARGADLIVTVGGASVGDHDLVGVVAATLGMQRAFYKVAMRPGKPLMAGRLGDAVLLGLPGNPVSALVCGHVFLAPMIRAMQGLPAAPAPRRTAPLAADLPANGPREHYMRARLDADGLHAFDRQDSALLGLLAAADALLIRPAGDPPRARGTPVDYLPL